MKTEPILSKTGNNVVGLKILEKDITNTDPSEIAKLLAEYGCILFKQITTPIEKYYDWQLEFGYHQHGNLWCNDKERPIFYRVTNKQLTENEEGLFGHGELDWHQNILFVPNAEESVGLYGLDVDNVAATTLANSIPLWRNLSKEEKLFFSKIKMRITNKSEHTYLKKMAHYVLPTAEQMDFDRKRNFLHIESATNFEEENKGKYPEHVFLKKNFLKLKPVHPLGTDGIYFPMYNIEYMADENNEILPNHREVFDRIKELYVDNTDYRYTHHWEKGDVFLMEQLTTIHKREYMDPSITRELIRTASWYKTSVRTSFAPPLL
jgi:alpha-ketoglutarate-dependent taurine dioxygenase